MRMRRMRMRMRLRMQMRLMIRIRIRMRRRRRRRPMMNYRCSQMLLGKKLGSKKLQEQRALGCGQNKVKRRLI